jgi:hypothetical protein
MTDYRKLGVTAEDPPGSEFDMYSLATPEGEWAYCLAEHCVLYRRAGWPFGDAHIRGRPWRPLCGEPRPRGVRVSPDTQDYSWRNEYVLLYPGRLGEHDEAGTSSGAHAWLNLWVRKQGMGGIIVPRVAVDIDLDAETASVADTCQAAVREQADMKAQRLLAFLLDHQRKARTPGGKRRPVTAH